MKPPASLRLVAYILLASSLAFVFLGSAFHVGVITIIGAVDGVTGITLLTFIRLSSRSAGTATGDTVPVNKESVGPEL